MPIPESLEVQRMRRDPEENLLNHLSLSHTHTHSYTHNIIHILWHTVTHTKQMFPYQHHHHRWHTYSSYIQMAYSMLMTYTMTTLSSHKNGA